MTNGDSFSYHCFNCGFKAGWSPGKLLSANTRKLLEWLGLPQQEVQRLSLEAMKSRDDQPTTQRPINFELPDVELPANTLRFSEIMNPDPDFIQVVEYVLSRGQGLDWYDWMWSPSAGYKDRVIIPFYHDQRIVGFTARKITAGRPKYITHTSPGYVFNLSAQPMNRRYLILVEGQFDAIAVDGCAVMHNTVNEAQLARLQSLDREIIVVPDRDAAGAGLVAAAIENNWSVSLPPWESQCKDVADAVARYGRLYTLTTILHYREHNNIKLELIKRRLENERS